LRVVSTEALSFWADRLASEGIDSERDGTVLSCRDPEGMRLALRVVETDDEPLLAVHPDIPAELALQGFDGVRSYATEPDASRAFLEEALAFEPSGESAWEVRGDDRGSFYAYDEPPPERGLSGAGTVHHVAWASPMTEHEAWRERVAQAGARPTPVIDRFYFRSVYFREPSGVLFEIATIGPGFTADEPQETLGEALSLPPAYEPLRERLEHVLTPLPDPRPARTAK
jgi:glyoxalase family protein